MKLDSLVRYQKKTHEEGKPFFVPAHVVGRIIRVKGKKWTTVEWSDGIILEEHINDIEII